MSASGSARLTSRWRAPWYCCCGYCTPTDCASHCIAFYLPCIAYGYTTSTAFRTSFWKECGRVALILAIMAVVYITSALEQPWQDRVCNVQRLQPQSAETPYLSDYNMDTGALNQSSTSPVATQGSIHSNSPAALVAAVMSNSTHVAQSGLSDGACGALSLAMMLWGLLPSFATMYWAWCVGGPARTYLRKRLGIPARGHEVCDSVLHCCCTPCVLAQEMRTVRYLEAAGKLPKAAAPAGYKPLEQNAPEVDMGMIRTKGGDAMV